MAKVLKTTTLVRMWVTAGILCFGGAIYGGSVNNFLALSFALLASVGFLLAAGYARRLKELK